MWAWWTMLQQLSTSLQGFVTWRTYTGLNGWHFLDSTLGQPEHFFSWFSGMLWIQSPTSHKNVTPILTKCPYWIRKWLTELLFRHAGSKCSSTNWINKVAIRQGSSVSLGNNLLVLILLIWSRAGLNDGWMYQVYYKRTKHIFNNHFMYDYCTCISLPMIAISTMIQRMMRGILGYFSWQTSARCIPVKNSLTFELQ